MLTRTAKRCSDAVAGRPMLAARVDSSARVIVLRPTKPGGAGACLLEYALSTAPLGRIVLDALHRPAHCADRAPAGPTIWAIPRHWQAILPGDLGQNVLYTDTVTIDLASLGNLDACSWLLISNGRFVARMNRWQLEQGLADADVVAVMADPELAAYRERVRLTREGRLVGYRRMYRDSQEPIPMPADWPHHLVVRREAVAAILHGGLPDDFGTFVATVRSRGVRLKSIAVAGSSIDLGTEDGLLSVVAASLDGASCCAAHGPSAGGGPGIHPAGDGGISPRSRFVGPVRVGANVCVEADAVVIGPSLLCDRSAVRAGAVVHASIVGTDAEIPRDQIVRHSLVVTDAAAATRHGAGDDLGCRAQYVRLPDADAFRSWPWLSYARCFKRVADIVTAIVVLVLFAPIIPLIALAVKITSPGPAFFRDRRQGLHGKPFYCVKFRTMRVGADKLQDKLRFISDVDGPQFKMTDDPRITMVGRFLRETYLDEIPQFYNVLVGDMSVVGPRPSPEAENTLCPWWRDARLSVRPGITGLWQINRTREPMKDFQEWIHFDTRYVREFSWRLDLWICWRTFRRMIVNFINQFF
ncbi:MAG: sugar transferase [Sedimentisphaerales bacterium]|nr:sugar transferase [Sedimentisphaerales bacterium]